MLGGLQPEPNQRLGKAHRGGDAVDHGNAELGGEILREIGMDADALYARGVVA